MTHKIFLVGMTLALVAAATSGCAAKTENEILFHVRVLTDEPPDSYHQLLEGTPDSMGVYEFYLEQPDMPSSGAFRQLDSIPLEKVNEEFYGTKSINKIDGTLCIGYPSTNFIDGQACVKIDQTQNEVDITVHYWKTGIAIAGEGG